VDSQPAVEIAAPAKSPPHHW